MDSIQETTFLAQANGEMEADCGYPISDQRAPVATDSGFNKVIAKPVEASDDSTTNNMQFESVVGVGFRMRGVIKPQGEEDDIVISKNKGEDDAHVAGEHLSSTVEPLEEPAEDVTYETDEALWKFVEERPRGKGVICRDSSDKMTISDYGLYKKGEDYDLVRDGQLHGDGALCIDLKTGTLLVNKTAGDKQCEEEVKINLLCKDYVGIPKVFGVIYRINKTEIFYQFPGLPMKLLIDNDHESKLRGPNMALLFAFQGFSTLGTLKCQGMCHRNLNPQNLCVDIDGTSCWLKFINFEITPTSVDQVTERLACEYLSPESCRTLLQFIEGKIPAECVQLGPENDVWALAMSLKCFLKGHDTMQDIYKIIGADPPVIKDTLSKKRALSIISQLKDNDIDKLIDPQWPVVLQNLMKHTLHVKPADRWTAEEATTYILDNWIYTGDASSVKPYDGRSSLEPYLWVPRPSVGFTWTTPPMSVPRPSDLPL